MIGPGDDSKGSAHTLVDLDDGLRVTLELEWHADAEVSSTTRWSARVTFRGRALEELEGTLRVAPDAEGGAALACARDARRRILLRANAYRASAARLVGWPDVPTGF